MCEARDARADARRRARPLGPPVARHARGGGPLDGLGGADRRELLGGAGVHVDLLGVGEDRRYVGLRDRTSAELPYSRRRGLPYRANLDTTVLGFVARMDALTINEAAETTGWSPRMLRYVERVGLVEPARSDAGYRLYGPAELQRLRTLRELLAEHDIGLSDLAFALRLRSDDRLRSATDDWLEARAERPEHVPVPNWLRWEQEKHQRLLSTTTPLTEVA